VPFFLEATDLPKRKEMADVMRKVLGLEGGAEGEQAPDPEKQQMAEALQQMQAQMEQMGMELADKTVEDTKRQAEVAKLNAQTQQIRADTATKALTSAVPETIQP